MRTFSGFPAGKASTVKVPSLFFSELLPLIDNVGELKLTVYCFWALQQREGEHRYVRLSDLSRDEILLASLADDLTEAKRELHVALDNAIERGTLLHIRIPGPPVDDLYFMNTDRGRRAIESLQRGDWTPGTGDHPIGLINERPNIFVLYERHIGPITPMMADMLRDAEKTYPHEWIEDGFKIAVENNKRSWRYVEAILKRWFVEGRTEQLNPGANSGENPYLDDEYFRRQS